MAVTRFASALGFVILVFSLCCIISLSGPPLCDVDSTGFVKPLASQGARNSSDLHVLVFPILSRQESDDIILAAEVAAQTHGWHNKYAGTELEQYGTTDLELRNVPELWGLVAPHLHKAVSGARKVLAHANLLDSHDVAFHDIFLVRYSSDGQRLLGSHEDGSVATFQVALNQAGIDFDEGGTFFDALGCRLQPNAGEAHAFPGHIRHQGLEITRGSRYILVGFYKGFRRDDENVGLSFGSAYDMIIGPGIGESPCLGSDEHASFLVAEVSWWGCSSDAFLVNRSQKGDVGWMWVERRPSYNCAKNKTRRRALRLSHIEQVSRGNASTLLALPFGHEYNAIKLDECPFVL